MPKEELKEVPIEKIALNPHQPRNDFIDAEIEELAESIKKVGLLHPPLVRSNGSHYELISGERRLRAYKLAGFTTIPVVVVPEQYQYSAQAALIENIQRSDLNPIEISQALKKLIEQYSWSQEKLADQIGKKRSTVANYLRLLSLDPTIQNGVRQGAITMGHAKAILAMKTNTEQLSLYKRVVEKELTVRETELAALKETKPKKQKISVKEVHLHQLEEKIQEKLGTKVTIKGKNSRGKICIDYYNYDDLDRILAFLAIDLSL